MTYSLKRREVLQVAAASAVAWSGLSRAQASAWPAKPVTLVVPFAAGGGTDAFGRPLSAQFAKQTGKSLVIENRGGAGGTVGASLAAKAAPDGYTLFMGAVHHTIAPSMYPKLDYNIETDFVPLVLAASVPQIVVVNPKNVPTGDYKSFIELVRKSPGRFNYGSAGAGTSHHLAGELFKQQTKTFITHIPYTGAGPALRDLVGGQVDIMFDGLGSSSAHIKAGRIKGLMVSGSKRNAAFPDIPCAAEVGLPDYNVTTWYGLWAPKGTPADVQARVADELRKAISADEMKAIWASNGAEFPAITSAQFGGFVSAEVKRWAAVVKASGAKLE
ncbi:MAG: tripartite tricarboxylate transporter substrate binding protein [Pseudomonadota bacterium]